jgi:hypothetical protein
MKTNQMMTVKIGEYGSINIYHKDGLGKVSDVINACNYSDTLKGGKGNLTIDNILKSIEFWKYVIELSILEVKKSKELELSPYFKSSVTEELELSPYFKSCETQELEKVRIIANYDLIYKNLNKKGEVNYKSLIKMFPTLIKSKRGKYGGTWASLPVLLKIASLGDKAIEATIYDTIVNSGLLDKRDKGGELSKKLNDLIKTNLVDGLTNMELMEELYKVGRFYKNPYQMVSILINQKVNSAFSEGWNDKDKDKQELRVKVIEKIITAFEFDLINDFIDLVDIMEKIKL